MIVWTEQKPDFRHKHVDELFSGLPFTATCAVAFSAERIKIIARRTVIVGIWSHLSEQSIELGGLLIGSVYNINEEHSQFIVSVEDWARSDEYEGTSVSLCMQRSVWDRARGKAGERSSVIGWYHSHPNLGAFFSGTDRRTQAAFFNHRHCLGLVIDPIRNEQKWFIGPNSDEVEGVHVLTRG
jgi:proteasome lid subunit RPN8/RPN11